MHKRVRFNQEHKAHSYYDNADIFNQITNENPLKRRFTKISISHGSSRLSQRQGSDQNEGNKQIFPNKSSPTSKFNSSNGKEIQGILQDVSAGINPFFENMELSLLEEIKGKTRGKGWNLLSEIVSKMPQNQALVSTIQKMKEEAQRARKVSEISGVVDKQDRKRKSSKTLLTLEDFRTSDNAIESDHYRKIQLNIQQLDEIKREF